MDTSGGCTTSPGILTVPDGVPVRHITFGTSMKVYLIWAIVPDQPTAPWVVAAWDEESRAENEDGWLEELAAAEKEYGARHIRVTVTGVNYDRVRSAFEPVEI